MHRAVRYMMGISFQSEPASRPNSDAGDDLQNLPGNSIPLVLSWLDTLEPQAFSHKAPDYCNTKREAPLLHAPGHCPTTMMPSSRGSSPRKRQRNVASSADSDGEPGDMDVSDPAQVTPRPLRHPRSSSSSGGGRTFSSTEPTEDPFTSTTMTTMGPAGAGYHPFTNPPGLISSSLVAQSRVVAVPLRSSSSRTSTTTTSYASGNSRRSRSPTKNPVQTVADLRYLEKPVKYLPLAGVSLPAGVRALSLVIRNICGASEGIFPLSIKDEVLSETGLRAIETMFAPGLSREAAQSLLEQAHHIMQASTESRYWRRSEAAWNLLVHWPMLKLALADVKNVMPELITAAQILPSFLPRFLSFGNHSPGVSVSQGKMVDFAILLAPPPSSALYSSLDRLSMMLPPGERSLNQTDYGPLELYPAPVAIETKGSGGDMDQAKVQLGVWVAAWFKRMNELVPPSRRVHGNRHLAVPLLAVHGDNWSLYYACETDDSICIYEQQRIGATDDLVEIFKLLAVLREGATRGIYASMPLDPDDDNANTAPSGNSAHRGEDARTLNPTDCGPRRFFPAPVAIRIDTNNNNNNNDAARGGASVHVQQQNEAEACLGVWTAAWFKKMDELRHHRPRPRSGHRGRNINDNYDDDDDDDDDDNNNNNGCQLAVPLMSVRGEDWKLYYD
ncbi:hypothetical protein VTJ49DRAFT_2866 [Mycothermus thermophilus]|uniref:PD-(D/E)XK nuclease-like domain-containing protein n=1 Tax=Humicola insolens TaxID=85995 RepID=A0ABR3V901_HUMIN